MANAAPAASFRPMPNSPSSSNCSRSSDMFREAASRRLRLAAKLEFGTCNCAGRSYPCISLLRGIAMNPVALEIRRLPVAELNPAPYNPRRALKPTDPAYRKLEASLREFGLVEPLVWNETTGYVVGGHARL